MSEQYDLLVVGAGPAGYVGAIRAAQLGARTAVIERDSWGGTCLNRGCIPSKALIHACEAIESARQARTFGVTFGDPKIDFDALRSYKTRVVKQLVSGVELLLQGNKVTKVKGTARLLSPTEVEVADGSGEDRLRASKILLCTGAVPLIPPIPGFDGPKVFSSDEAVDLPGPFESIVIVGAGALGCEFAYIYSQLGTKVTLIEMLPHVLPAEDAEVAEVLAKSLKKGGVKILTGAKVLGTTQQGDWKQIMYETDGEVQTVEAEALLIAIGRRAVVKGLGLEEIGVATDRPGIRINERQETTVEGVYAAGDCVRGPGLAHLASHEAVAAVENMFGEGGHVNYDCVPGAIYTHPEVASVGLSQAKAEERGIEVTVGTFPFAANSRAVATREREGLVKLVAAADTGRLLGASIIGPSASDLIAEPTLAVQLGASASDVAETIHSHPTFSEAVHEAALDVAGASLHMPPKVWK